MAAPLVAAIIGSGTIEQTRAILPASQRGSEELGEGVRTGLQVMLGNPEDVVAVDAFATSGISVGLTVPVLLVGPNTNPLPRCRGLRIYNTTTSTLFLGPREDFDFVNEGYPIIGSAVTRRTDDIPLLHNVEVWALATGAISEVRMIIY